jgi:hypothetical protein
MDSSGGPPLPLILRDELGVTSAELAELMTAGVAYDKHPEAAQ